MFVFSPLYCAVFLEATIQICTFHCNKQDCLTSFTVSGNKRTCHVSTCNGAEQSTMVWNFQEIEHHGKDKRGKMP
jgi:hypothetical protein